MRVHVAHFQRNPRSGNFSIERLFRKLRSLIPSEFGCEEKICPHFSEGVINRILNVIWAYQNQRCINHITGDVHYLMFGLSAPTVLTIHDCVSLHRLSGFKKWLVWLVWYYFPTQRANQITTISHATKKELEHALGVRGSRVRVISNCIPGEIRRTLTQPKPYPPRVLFIGLAENKNLERVVKALKGLSCELRIVGQLTQAQHGLLRDSGIAFSYVARLTDEDIQIEYESAVLLAFPSLYEGFGLPIVEANTFGCPVVTSELPPMCDVAADAACLVNPLSVESIRAGIKAVLDSEEYRMELIRKGYVNVKRFNAEALAEAYSVVYRELASDVRNVI
jgi:glycosyltransferase involved in cell wall biosynthesis